MRTVRAIRYLTPLREGGSVPAIVEADDDGTYVAKFFGAAQGPRALVAELIGGEIGRLLGLPVPRIVLIEIDALLARSEPDEELQELLRKSAGLNLALDYLPGSLNWEPGLAPPPDAELAARVVWFDAFITNVDRTPRNPNMLRWHKALHLIDHGAALYFHHDWDGYLERSVDPFSRTRDHVLLPFAAKLAEVDALMADRLTPRILAGIVDAIPAGWLDGSAPFDATAQRAAYLAYLTRRLQAPRAYAEEALRARNV